MSDLLSVKSSDVQRPVQSPGTALYDNLLRTIREHFENRGYRFGPGEVEGAISKALPHIDEYVKAILAEPSKAEPSKAAAPVPTSINPASSGDNSPNE